MKINFPKLQKKYLNICICALFVVAIVFVVLFAKNKKRIPLENLAGNVEISTSLKYTDLSGHSVFVLQGGIVLDNIENGEIIICESVGAGTITFKNCQNINVIVKSKANLLLDGNTSIQNLSIKDNAKISSIKSLEDKYRKKSFGLFKRHKVETQPEILNTEIDSDLNPLLEGGDFISIKENNTNFGGRSTDAVDAVSKTSSLTLFQDTSYKGNGVRILISNKPKNANALSVVKRHNRINESIDFVSKNQNSERFFSDSYTYEFLAAGEKYDLEFIYQDILSDKIESAVVSVIPKKGEEFFIDRTDVFLLVDAETGNMKLLNYPKTNLPLGAKIVYQLESSSIGDWNFIGLCVTSAFEKRQLNLYRDFGKLETDKVLDGKVYVNVYYEYNGFRWSILNTSVFDFNYDLCVTHDYS